MTRYVMLNGTVVPFEHATLSIMDRGFLFADGIYEVSAVLDGKLVDNEAHLARLDRSLDEIAIARPYTMSEWTAFQEALIAKNGLQEGVVYIQVTRGVAERDFTYEASLSPTTVMFTQPKAIVNPPLATTGARVISLPEIRWQRRDIKSIALLAQVMAKQQAAAAGAHEAFMVEDGFITEGGSSNVFIITGDRRLVTRPLSNRILPGITRKAILALAKDENLQIEERPFSVTEALDAAELFYTSASTFVAPVVSLDGKVIGSGKPGALTLALREHYIRIARQG